MLAPAVDTTTNTYGAIIAKYFSKTRDDSILATLKLFQGASVNMSTAPKAFYRVQHRSSYTRYDKDGFYANARYSMHYHHWINQAKFNNHLNRKDRPLEPTPYISVFENLGARQTVLISRQTADCASGCREACKSVAED